MDNGPLWSQDPYGNYWIVFPNKHALIKDEIKEIFSEFGKVKMVTESGDEKGLRFVQYSCLDDVKNAVDNLKGHPQIKLVPYRPKNVKNQNTTMTKEANTNVDPDKRNFYERKPANTYNHKNRIVEPDERKSSSDSCIGDFHSVDYNERNFDQASTCSSNASHSRRNLNNLSTSNNYNDISHTTHVSSPTQRPKSAGSTEDKVKMLLRVRGMTSNTFHTDAMANGNNVDCDCDDELPDLVPGSKVKAQAMPRKIIYNADEVIVANIPNDYGSAYLLHLFEKFEPLAISYVKTAPRNEIRYCHVYFKSVEDSIGVEKMFDKYNLSGQRLVVLRTCNLEEEIRS